MSEKVRVYDLARELGLSNKELLEMLRAEGLEVKSHASTIEQDFADLIREQVLAERRSREAQLKKLPSEIIAASAQEEEEEEEEEALVGESGRPILHLKPPVVVRDLAEALGLKPNVLIAELMAMNVFAAINQVIEPDIVRAICERHGYEFVAERRKRSKKAKTVRKRPEKAEEGVVPRPPVVAFLGHVDHGKTSLQDRIRKTNVAEGEEGGITQHIGASVVEWEGKKITFIDTPGHEAFTAMRARGAHATDIVVLVVAADDGVMPQTIEAINHARAAEVPIIVAINKIDLPSAKPEKVMLQLQEQGLQLEEWGGDVGVVQVSALTGEGIDDLLERILLEAEMLELRANPELPGRGVVIEAQVERGLGPTVNVLVRNGTFHVGDPVICGEFWGRVRALIDHAGRRVKSIGPSMPVKLTGLSGAPKAGEIIEVAESEEAARTLAEQRAEELRESERASAPRASLDDLFRQIEEQKKDELKLIVKADTQGTAEAICEALKKLESDKIRITILHAAPGEVTENDVLLASASDAIIVGFHVRAMPGVNKVAKREGVEIRLYGIIYELIDDVRDAIRGRLQPEKREVLLGRAEILQIFRIRRTGKICGCRVQEGTVRVGANARVLRGDDVIYNGSIASLRHYQDDVREVSAGQECGIRLDNFEDFEPGDVIEVFQYEETPVEI